MGRRVSLTLILLPIIVAALSWAATPAFAFRPPVEQAQTAQQPSSNPGQSATGPASAGQAQAAKQFPHSIPANECYNRMRCITPAMRRAAAQRVKAQRLAAGTLGSKNTMPKAEVTK